MIWPLGLSVVGALLVLLTRLGFPENSITGAVASNALTSANVVALIMVIAAVAIVYILVQ